MNRRGIQAAKAAMLAIGFGAMVGAAVAQSAGDQDTADAAGQPTTTTQPDTTRQQSPTKTPPQKPPKWQPAKRIIDVQVTAARQSDYVREMIRKEGGSDVPVLLPYSMTKDEATANAYKMRMRLRRDDYTVVLHQPHMDIVIIGTSRYFPGDRAVREDRQNDYTMPYERFTDGEGGAFSFGRFGADYLVEFFCLPLEGGGLNQCMDEAGARAFVDELVSGG